MAKAKILIADDDQDIRESVQAILEGRQYEVVTAADRRSKVWRRSSLRSRIWSYWI